MIWVRRIDDLGRVVIPKELRYEMGIDEGDTLAIELKDGCISIKKYVDIADEPEGLR
jgi:AbrB family looped-hinge helix DNA binding protein